MNKTLHTKFGTAKVDEHGYYRITTSKEGNNRKLLHRLIFADYWQIEDINEFFGEKIDIHHIDGNKLNNELNNLEPIPSAEHTAMHRKNKTATEETKKKMSEQKKSENNPMYGNYGKKNPASKYSLWDTAYVKYMKGAMFTKKNKKGEDSRICFYAKYKGEIIPCGGFYDFITPQIIVDLMMETLDE